MEKSIPNDQELPDENRETAFRDSPSFKELLLQKRIDKELFLPVESADWEDDRYRMDNPSRSSAAITGVRLLEWDPDHPGGVAETETQTDLVTLVRAVRELRRWPGYEATVLSSEWQLGAQEGHLYRGRARFGLLRRRLGAAADREAAQVCHAQVAAAIATAGFSIVAPKTFDASSGLDGLENWASQVRLRRRRRLWPRALPLLPLLALLWLLWPRGPSGTLGPLLIDSDFVVIVDRSGRMADTFPAVRRETKNLIDKMRGRSGELIYFDESATPAFGSIETLTDQRVAELDKKLDDLDTTTTNNLEHPIRLSAGEVLKHGKRTTLIIITDGLDDAGLDDMVGTAGKLDEVKSWFGNVDVVIDALTPRMLNLTPVEATKPLPPDPNPDRREAEQKLTRLCKAFNGTLGPQPLVSHPP